VTRITVFDIILIFTALVVAITTLMAQEAHEPGHGHPPEDLSLHSKFYNTWMRPDQPELSCCSNHDCYPTQARHVNGHWEALRREDKQWIRIPESKIERKRDMPDAQAHLCAVSPSASYFTGNSNSDVFCFGAGGGT